MANLGRDRKLYINTGTFAVPIFLLAGRIENVSLPRSYASSTHDFRESNHTKTVTGNVAHGLEFEYLERPDTATDPVLTALQTAADSGDATEFAVMRGDIGTSGVTGTRGFYVITDAPEEQATNDRVKHSFTLAEADHYESGEPIDVSPYTVP